MFKVNAALGGLHSWRTSTDLSDQESDDEGEDVEGGDEDEDCTDGHVNVIEEIQRLTEQLQKLQRKASTKV